MIPTLGYAAFDATSPLAPWSFERREPGARDVQIEILYCGICHSDLHTVRAEWGRTSFPLVPGHEIVGRVSRVGADVSRFRVGDAVGVGCLVDSCRRCASCGEGLEQYCGNGSTATYGSLERQTGGITQGGYSRDIVVDQDFVLRIPDGMDFARTAPLLCAGITTYSPLREWNVTRGTRVGVVGLGGLGHMAVKLAHAMGAEVTLLTTSESKRDDAIRLGARDVVLSTDQGAMRRVRRSLDLILDTVSAPHDLAGELDLLDRDGTLVLLGGSPDPHPFPSVWRFITHRRRLAGSLIGGIAETQEMLDFCAAHNVLSDIELITPDRINEAYERMLRSDVKYRFVIDVGQM
jgi:uncharacterized zinc-type alcohol dehydrogenase-like protein